MVRRSLSAILFAVLLFGMGYFYYAAHATCPIPITYRIGTIDSRFHLTPDEARLAASEAESVWEDATGQNLFTYSPKGAVSINFVYDNRQAKTTAEGQFKATLDQTQSVSDQIHTEYEKLVAKYNDLKSTYDSKVKDYQTALDAYNKKVATYNAQGGAPTDVYKTLQQQKQSLNDEQASLNTLASQLNELVKNINTIGAQGNSVISSYNKGVAEYNKTFGESSEFTQGTYSTDHKIDVYAYANHQELIEVLAHEMGHAMGLNHVTSSSSIMYYKIGSQPNPLKPSPQDLAEFANVCGSKPAWQTMYARLHTYLFNTLH